MYHVWRLVIPSDHFMASIPTILIKNSDPEAYNLGTIIQSPRTCTTIDVRQACANLDFVPPGEGLERSALVESFVRYLFTQYFVLAHQSGLYNQYQSCGLFGAFAWVFAYFDAS